MAEIIPGVLTNEENDYVERLSKAQSVSRLVQIDVVDGKFAPSTTIGVDEIKKHPPTSSLEVQLMVINPSEYIAELTNLDYVSRVIFPFEIREDLDKNITAVKAADKEVGLSINPETDVSEVSPFAKTLDVLCIFSASPGFSGKKLEEAVYGRISQSKKLYPQLAVEVDIGVNVETAPKLVQAGADFLVATSALHNAADYQIAYDKLVEAMRAQ